MSDEDDGPEFEFEPENAQHYEDDNYFELDNFIKPNPEKAQLFFKSRRPHRIPNVSATRHCQASEAQNHEVLYEGQTSDVELKEYNCKLLVFLGFCLFNLDGFILTQRVE
jgi:hypothetical protein